MVEKLTLERFEPGTNYKEYSLKFKEFMEGKMVSTTGMLSSEYETHLKFEEELAAANDGKGLQRLVDQIKEKEIHGSTPNIRSMKVMITHKANLIEAGQADTAAADFEQLTVARTACEVETAETAEELKEIERRLNAANQFFGANTVFTALCLYATYTRFEKFGP